MNKLFLISTLIISLFTNATPVKDGSKRVTISFKNNSILPRKYTIISYSPEQEGNSTNGVMMLPYGTKEFTVTAGTKFYLADNQQVSIVMSGNKLNGKPFYVVKAEDNDKTINLRED